jgi:hypothetical protein
VGGWVRLWVVGAVIRRRRRVCPFLGAGRHSRRLVCFRHVVVGVGVVLCVVRVVVGRLGLFAVVVVV